MKNYSKTISGVNGSVLIEGGSNGITLTIGTQYVNVPTKDANAVCRALEWASYAAERDGLTEPEQEIADRQIMALSPKQYDNIANRIVADPEKQPF